MINANTNLFLSRYIQYAIRAELHNSWFIESHIQKVNIFIMTLVMRLYQDQLIVILSAPNSSY